MITGYFVLGIYVAGMFLVCLDFSSHVKEIHKRMIFDAFCLLLVFLAAMKNPSVSPDTEAYVDFFYRETPPLSLNILRTNYFFESGYVFLNSAVKYFRMDYHMLFFIVAAISVLLYRHVILKYSKYRFLSLFTYISCFYFLNEIVIIRSGIAGAIILFNICSIVEKKYVRAVITVLIAMSFHSIAIVGILPLLMYGMEHERKEIVRLISIGTIWISVMMRFISVFELAKLAGMLLPFLQPKINKLFGLYLHYSGGSCRRILIYLPYYGLALLGAGCFQKKKQGAGSRLFCQKYRISLGNVPLMPAHSGTIQNPARLDSVILYYVTAAMACIIALEQIHVFSRASNLLFSILVIAVPQFAENQKKRSSRFLIIAAAVMINSLIFFRQNFFNTDVNLFRF
ncbi:MAG: EpsG family protein [Eubacterium sp.]|jgi:hypothetical protein|nr:EpsG family protein [Eubacterium sp.]